MGWIVHGVVIVTFFDFLTTLLFVSLAKLSMFEHEANSTTSRGVKQVIV